MHVNTFFILFFSERAARGGGGSLPDFIFCSIFPVQQTTSVIDHRVIKYLVVFSGWQQNTLQLWYGSMALILYEV